MIRKGLCQNECFDAAPLRCVRISKMQGIEDEGDRSFYDTPSFSLKKNRHASDGFFY